MIQGQLTIQIEHKQSARGWAAGDCPGSGVGGIAELADQAGTPLEAPDSSGSNSGLIAGIVAAIAAGTVTLGGAALYARRRSIQ